jgi:glutamine amidotransferase PdxT
MVIRIIELYGLYLSNHLKRIRDLLRDTNNIKYQTPSQTPKIHFLYICNGNTTIMVTIIKKGTSSEKIKIALKKRKLKVKGPDLKKYCGSISLKEDPLEMQKKWRDEMSHE